MGCLSSVTSAERDGDRRRAGGHIDQDRTIRALGSNRLLSDSRGALVEHAVRIGQGDPPLLLDEEAAGRTDIENLFDVPADHRRVRDYSRDGVLRSIEQSLERLGLDHIDIVLVHDPDEHEREALEGAFPALSELRDQGVIRSFGAGMNQSSMLARFVRETDADVMMVAGRWTLLDRSAADDLMPLAAQRGVSVLAAAVFNSGILAMDDPAEGATFDYGPADVSPTPVREALTRLEAEGLVAKRALKGYAAAPLLDEAGLRDLYDMRELLEPEAARRASTQLDQDVESELSASVVKMRTASAPDDDETFRNYRRFIDEDLHFHHLIAEQAQSPLLSEAIVRLRSHMHLYRLNFRHDFEHDTVSEHERILEALRRRDPAAAAEAMRTHIENSYRRLGPALARRAENASE
ncbi:aldo/keto reductase [Microbacterium hydrocarbonoxydans]|uniref:DNA-binding transcriptional regulator, GntR family n=1 Tax=Microbacterium hydrocarbonoxydans TaxID=273678 RepID=A0A1H4ITV4_9MICO|nr:aldo/keto reductase [Microbacterium hydrocarbonoxydans]SEB37433.1 DNA-binding transcriptional regulator, GntR family [Microbacterium hydrocarbonoxydans]